MERSRNSKSCCDMLNRCDENAQVTCVSQVRTPFFDTGICNVWIAQECGGVKLFMVRFLQRRKDVD